MLDLTDEEVFFGIENLHDHLKNNAVYLWFPEAVFTGILKEKEIKAPRVLDLISLFPSILRLSSKDSGLGEFLYELVGGVEASFSDLNLLLPYMPSSMIHFYMISSEESPRLFYLHGSRRLSTILRRLRESDFQLR